MTQFSSVEKTQAALKKVKLFWIQRSPFFNNSKPKKKAFKTTFYMMPINVKDYKLAIGNYFAIRFSYEIFIHFCHQR